MIGIRPNKCKIFCPKIFHDTPKLAAASYVDATSLNESVYRRIKECFFSQKKTYRTVIAEELAGGLK